MEVVRAKTAGFCMGVDLALNKLDSLIDKSTPGDIYTLGPIIHNPQVLARYEAMGVFTVESPEDIPAGACGVIRAHGVTKSVEQGLVRRGVEVVDATCPRVKRAQLLIEKQTGQGRELLLYGETEHPEVKGLLSYSLSRTFVFDCRERLMDFGPRPDRRYCLAAQTTQDKVAFEGMARELKSRPDIDLVTLDTICDATRLRQKEAVNIARTVDCMVVVGGYISGNTRRLVQVAEDQRVTCFHVETASELP
ncbi:MAG: 4-hydroxy-3-methylbut-2-enyl diphosphate reductase, partial [Desulfovibrionaceae bacterium]|nr:4-hydroxy-3-methylbut-2-enyl diphosphate reductase [Desulfovibrionaceae bacterium]